MNNIFENIDSLQGLSLLLNGVFLGAIIYLYKTKEKRVNDVVDEHKDDLKKFDSERAKTVNEITQTMHKIAFSIEKNESSNNDITNSLNKLILLAENIKSKLNG